MKTNHPSETFLFQEEKSQVKNVLPCCEGSRRVTSCPWARATTPVEGGAPVLNNTINVTAAPSGAAFPGAGSPGTDLSAVGGCRGRSLPAGGMDLFRMPYPVPVAVATDARLAAFGQIPAMTQKQLV